MVHSCNKPNCPYKRKSQKKGRTMRGGGCPCNKSGGLFSGGRRRSYRRRSYRRKTNRRKTMRGGSAGLSSLSSSAYYPQNNYMNDMSDPSKQIAGRFTGVPDVSPTSASTLIKGGKSHKTYNYRHRPKKMQGGAGMFSSNNFLGTFGNASGINNTSSTWLGANTVNPPSYLQSAASVYTDNTNSGYNAQNPYLV